MKVETHDKEAEEEESSLLVRDATILDDASVLVEEEKDLGKHAVHNAERGGDPEGRRVSVEVEAQVTAKRAPTLREEEAALDAPTAPVIVKQMSGKEEKPIECSEAFEPLRGRVDLIRLVKIEESKKSAMKEQESHQETTKPAPVQKSINHTRYHKCNCRF